MHTIKLIFKYFVFYRKYIGNKVFFVFLLSALSGFAEGIGIIVLFPILTTYLKQDVLGSGNFIYMQNAFDYLRIDFKIEYALFFGVILIFSKAILIFSALSYSAYLKSIFLFSVKKELVLYFSNLKYKYYLTKTVGYFTNVANEQANKTAGAFSASIGLFVNFITTIVYILLAFIVAWQFAVLIIISGIVFYSIFKHVSNYTRKKSKDIAIWNGTIGNYFIELLEGYKYLTGTSQRSKFLVPLLGVVKISSKAHFQMGVAGAFIYSIREPIIFILIFGLAVFQINYFNSEISDVMISIFLFYRAINGVMTIQMSLQSLFESSGSIDLVLEEIRELKEHQEHEFGTNQVNLNKKMKIKDLTFSYVVPLKPALSSVSMEIKSGETVAIVGSSGAGKTSLVDVFCFLQRANSGSFEIDDVPYSECDVNFWRKHIGYVSQDAPLFHNSIIGNITMEKYTEIPCQKILDEVFLAAKMANIHDFITTLPEGYFTTISEGGHRLSGGQKQRLVIARELYRKPKLLILDEATSALDAESEVAIQKSIDGLKTKLTVIVIAHRLSTIKNVDRVYVMENGSIIEKGTYKSLSFREDSRLSELIRLQSL